MRANELNIGDLVTTTSSKRNYRHDKEDSVTFKVGYISYKNEEIDFVCEGRTDRGDGVFTCSFIKANIEEANYQIY